MSVPETRTAIPVVKSEAPLTIKRDLVTPTVALLDAIRDLGLPGSHHALLPKWFEYADVEHALLWWAQANHATLDRFDRLSTISTNRIVGMRIMLGGREILTLHTPDEIVEERERPKVAGTWSVTP